ncbi:MAG TPA: penicillin acylase family protein [Rhodanobacter sp.]
MEGSRARRDGVRRTPELKARVCIACDAVVDVAYAQMPPTQKLQLDRYRDGVNAGLADLRARPWEYFLLGSKPQPWQSQDSLLLIATMYPDLNSDSRNKRELHIAQMRSALPGPLVDFLLSPDPDWEAPLGSELSHMPVLPATDVFDLRRPVAAASSAGVADAAAAHVRWATAGQ